MWLADAATAAPSRLLELALAAGVKHEHAGDVAGAVTVYCCARHGTDDLDDTYLMFLLERAGGPALNSESLMGDHFLYRALRAAPDPSSLYEAYQRKLVRGAASSLAPSGFAVHIQAGKIMVRPREELNLMLLPVFRKVADWACAWRDQDEGGVPVVITGRAGHPDRWPANRQLLVDCLRHREAVLGIRPADLRFSGG